jgi:glycosyltransferase involved in cell wall biosynthesis
MGTRPWLHWIRNLALYSEILDLMAVSRLVAITSRYETGPLVLLEAIGLGTPVVSTDVGRARELLTSDLGRVVRDDPISFAEGMREVLSWEPEEAIRAGHRARGRISFEQTLRGLEHVAKTVRSEAKPDGNGISANLNFDLS